MRLGSAGPPPALSALRHEQFRLLFGGLAASNLGIWMQQFALGWLVVQLAIDDGNPALAGFYLGLRSIASAVPALAFGLFAGVFADRMDRRTILVHARVASALVAVTLALVVVAGHANIGLVMLLSVAASAAFAFDPPGRQAILPNTVPPGDLFSAMGLTRAGMQAAHTIGPLLAGVLVIPLGVGGVLLAKAGLDMASVAALRRMRAYPVDASSRAIGVFGSLREGIGHVLQVDLIRWIVVLQIVSAVLAQSFMQLLPAVAVDTLRVGAVELSWLVAATGVGSLVGAFWLAGLEGVQRRGVLLLGTMLSVGVMLALLGLQRELLGTLMVLAALGVLQQLFLGTQTVILQLAAPDRLRGRVMGMQSVIFMSCGPLGVLGVGTLGTFIGISTAILIAGAAVAGVAVVALLRLAVIREIRADDGIARDRTDAFAPAPVAEGTD
ncbi:MAG: MFS transporter [Candidatus Limnocylindria bacterium]